MSDLLEINPNGLYCPAGDFYIDPWRQVSHAVITHAHADHARPGSDRYLCASPGKHVLRTRMGNNATINTVKYGEHFSVHGVDISLHPAGHLLGSSQVRVHHQGVTWVVTGDYKLQQDSTCECFESVPCDVFVTESTFGLPVYRWPEPATVANEINTWWRANADSGRTSVLLSYALGKAQRVASLLDPSIGPIYGHGAVMKLVEAYRASGVRLPPIDRIPPRSRKIGGGRGIVIAPPSAAATSWINRFGETSIAMVSGWMLLRGVRRRRGFPQGFILSDHVDYPDLMQAVKASGAQRVLVTHGFTDIVARLLTERGLQAEILPTRFIGEERPDDSDVDKNLEDGLQHRDSESTD
ncbi:MAG: ligase-associated DNA damage response exonuclease [Planctomycetaceae bacterium]|nr:ligase-associated DNA damage response exonuclease [Planctomycetaceae bacterium]MBT6054918.1 ligase-associated DNA damage response exonuclease [Planctomycetaceae bacterium]MBT6642852.1 ligase-associated DNA damage response exonuclease [Planctomycetaceae bacterium]MBT7729772.1 ligase-associated DNA damage response exonuclease [Planctomycetaceae bacterium]